MTTPDPYSIQHKPVYLLDYFHHDGPYAGHTDCYFISGGFAQYDPNDISIKLMRHTGDRWSRMAEELPPHRPIDAAAFECWILKALTDHDAVRIPSGFFEHQDEDIVLGQTAGLMPERRDLFRQKFATKLLKRRILRLGAIIDQLRRDGALDGVEEDELEEALA